MFTLLSEIFTAHLELQPALLKHHGPGVTWKAFNLCIVYTSAKANIPLKLKAVGQWRMEFQMLHRGLKARAFLSKFRLPVLVWPLLGWPPPHPLVERNSDDPSNLSSNGNNTGNEMKNKFIKTN